MAGRLPGDSHGRQPDWGKPTVRDDTGGLGKHGYGGIVHPPRNRKSGTGNPPPKVRAPEFYPDFYPVLSPSRLSAVEARGGVPSVWGWRNGDGAVTVGGTPHILLHNIEPTFKG